MKSRFLITYSIYLRRRSYEIWNIVTRLNSKSNLLSNDMHIRGFAALEFEKSLMQTLNSKGSSIIDSITKEKALNEKSEKDLQKIIEDLVNSYE